MAETTQGLALFQESHPRLLQQFLELDGLGSLISTVEQLSRSTSASDGSFSGAILQLDCISCVKAVLNTTIGMTYFLQHQNYTRKLVMGEYIVSNEPIFLFGFFFGKII